MFDEPPVGKLKVLGKIGDLPVINIVSGEQLGIVEHYDAAIKLVPSSAASSFVGSTKAYRGGYESINWN